MPKAAYIMSKPLRGRAFTAALCAATMALTARADAPNDQIVTRVTAEVMARPAEAVAGEKPEPKLQAAERVVPGDVLIYTVQVRNVGQYSVESAEVIQPLPRHTMYVADSAVGPGVDVDYSIDGGRSFDKPENLKSPHTSSAAAARSARATAADYTHIRWRLHNRLNPNAIAFVRFRAQVK
jgi:uncharacterized repeat protein (TIGR01451 family)